MTAEHEVMEKAKQVIDEWIEMLRDATDEDGELAEEVIDGWTDAEEWEDVEYRCTKEGRYRGVSLLQSNYDGSGLDVELDTTRNEIILRDADTEKIVMANFIRDENAVRGIEAIDAVWLQEFEELYV